MIKVLLSLCYGLMIREDKELVFLNEVRLALNEIFKNEYTLEEKHIL